MDRKTFLKNTLVTTSLFLSISPLSILSSCDNPKTKSSPLINEYLSETEIKNIINFYKKNRVEVDKDFSTQFESLSELSEIIENDFSNRKTIICNGWVLSQTEVINLILKK